MKRLITSVTLGLFSLIVLGSSVFAAVPRFTRTTISDPSTTSNRNLNIAFNVFSNLETDDQFGVQLFENNALKASQEIVHPNGDSGAFSVALPATGTYSYFVRSINHDNGDATQDSQTVSVQITNAPEPTVVTVNNGAAAGGAGGGAAANAANAAGAAAAQDGADGQVTDNAASTNEQNGNQDVLGAETKEDADKANSRRRNWYAAGILALAAAGAAAYYMLVVRRSTDA